MRSADLFRLGALLLAVAGCGGGGGGGGSGSLPGSGGGTDPNALALSVNGKLCHVTAGYPNKPCVAVTVCTPGTSQCQTIDDILLDTGSYGLRVFRQALGSVALQQVTEGGGSLATCVQFADQTSDWGPVQMADVVLGGEPAVRVPIHVLDSTFPTVPPSCPNPESSPTVAGFNGILGLGVFAQDCGAGCAASASNGIYFSCSASGCSGTTVPISDQVSNPVALLPLDNNGVIIDLPAVGDRGAASVEGTLLLGIGTRANNAATGVTAIPVNPLNGTFTTSLQGVDMAHSFLDTGSNGLFFTPPSSSVLPACTGNASSWFCPSAPVPLSATNKADAGSPSADVSFQIANFDGLAASSNNVFANLGGGSLAGTGFDWGLPFHLGRKVAVGFEQRTSTLGTGPLVAY